MRVRRLDPATHDMTFGHGANDYAGTSEAVIQKVQCRLSTLQAEWFLDSTVGVPWLPITGVAKPIMGTAPADLPYAEAQIKACILGTDGVESLVSFSLDFNHQTRAATVTAEVRTVYGDAQLIRILPVIPW